jgi:hypothetical protein
MRYEVWAVDKNGRSDIGKYWSFKKATKSLVYYRAFHPNEEVYMSLPRWNFW